MYTRCTCTCIHKAHTLKYVRVNRDSPQKAERSGTIELKTLTYWSRGPDVQYEEFSKSAVEIDSDREKSNRKLNYT